jgi:hypothetical protein
MTFFLMVDVRDVGPALVQILVSDVPAGTEITLTGPTCTWKQLVHLAKSEYPALNTEFAPKDEPTMTMDGGDGWCCYQETPGFEMDFHGEYHTCISRPTGRDA